MKYTGIFIISDMDHTLLNNNGDLSQENRAAIEEFINNGGMFTVATGRTLAGVEQYRDIIPMNSPGIIFNGAMVYDFKNKNILWNSFLPEETRKMIREIILEKPDLGIEIHTAEGLFIVKRNVETDKHMKREEIDPIYTDLECVPENWYKVILTESEKIIWKTENWVGDWLNRHSEIFRAVHTEPQFLELLEPNTSKGAALKKLVELTGINNFKVISAGDNMNDIELIKAADVGIAVENALDPVKKAADIVGCDNDSNIIRWILDTSHITKKHLTDD